MLYVIARAILRVIFLTFIRLKILGRENIPKEGGVILSSNHESALDGLIIPTVIKRKVYTMGKEELFKNPISAFFLRRLNVLPVKRGRVSHTTIRAAIELLKMGRVVLLFPEGTVSKDERLQEPQLGVGMLALKAKVPVVPVAISGSYKVLPRGSIIPKPGRVTVKFGEKIDFSRYYESNSLGKEAYRSVATTIMDEIRRLIDR